MAPPISTEMSSDSTVVVEADRFTTAYRQMSSHNVVRQRACRPPRPSMAAKATRAARYPSSAAIWLTSSLDIVIAS